MIILDSREPMDLQANLICTLGQPNVTVRAIPTGDVLMFDHDGCSVAIERKTIGDLINSFTSGRLDAQLGRLSALSYPILLVEGRFRADKRGKVLIGSSKTTDMGYAALQAKLWSIQRRLGIAVLYTQSHDDTVAVVKMLHTRCQRKECIKETKNVPVSPLSTPDITIATRQRRKVT